MMNHRLKAAVLIALVGATQVGRAEDATLGEVTAQDLLKLLVDEGVIDKTKLKALTEKIKERKRTVAGAAVESVGAEQRDAKPVADAQVVRVPYVPQYIKDEIRDQVRIGLKEDVSRDVLAQAKTERWGLPGALPEWINRIKFSGDMRLREESTFYASGNAQDDYFNIPYINSKGGFAGNSPDLFLNTTEDRNRLRARFRLGVNARVNDEFTAGARLVTGNQADPVSTNQTMGTYEQKWQNTFDLAYLKYSNLSKSFTFSGGRIENPFFSTDLVWDNDLTFEGVAASWWMLRSDSMDEEFRSFDPFITVGAFPLQEIDRSSHDKWLFSAQTGFQYDTADQSKFTLAAAYYGYKNIVGKMNALDDTSLDYTAPQALQKGNTLFNIRNDLDPSAGNALFAHAADYKLVDIFAEYDIANFAPVHVLVSADYVKNIGFDKKDVEDRINGDSGTNITVDARTKGYQARVAIGWPVISKARDWQVSFMYRYLERDAVLAEFTDSDFHGGGTDAKGYVLKFDYGIADNTWLSLRWLSSNEIDGDNYPEYTGVGTGKLGIDTLQLDLNAKF
ncbi:MAG TPA: putative porin [Spongiibacteraceae bacterium]|nr:putative porin [Spongiibacteraceae bacterium]